MHLNSSVAHTSNCFGSDGFPWAGDGAAGFLLLRFVRLWLLFVVAVLFRLLVVVFRAAPEPWCSFCSKVGFREPVCAPTPKFFIAASQICFFMMGNVYVTAYLFAVALLRSSFCKVAGVS